MSLSKSQLTTLQKIASKTPVNVPAGRLVRLFKAAGATETNEKEFSGTRLKFGNKTALIINPRKAQKSRHTIHAQKVFGRDVIDMARALNTKALEDKTP